MFSRHAPIETVEVDTGTQEIMSLLTSEARVSIKIQNHFVSLIVLVCNFGCCLCDLMPSYSVSVCFVTLF